MSLPPLFSSGNVFKKSPGEVREEHAAAETHPIAAPLWRPRLQIELPNKSDGIALLADVPPPDY
jgi:hypothetical protein